MQFKHFDPWLGNNGKSKESKVSEKKKQVFNKLFISHWAVVNINVIFNI